MPARSLAFSLTLALSVLPAAPLQAQEAAGIFLIGYGALSVGAVVNLVSRSPTVAPALGSVVRVRVRGLGDGDIVGRIAGLDVDSITMERDSARMRIARSDVLQMQVNIGARRRWATGWGIGLLGGAAVGGVAGFSSGDDKDGGWFSLTANEKAAIGAVALGILGSTAGAVIGLMAPDQWVGASGVGDGGRIAITPMIGTRAGLSARIQF